MGQSLQLTVKTSIFHREKTLKIGSELLEFGADSMTKFEVADLRYGVKAIKGYRFRIGRIYCIDIRSITGHIIKIRFKSLYRINKKKLEEKYRLILTALFDNFISDISRRFIEKFNKKVDFNLLGTTFTQEGICLNIGEEILPWIDIGTKDYWSYYSIFSNTSPGNYATFQYLHDWNTIVLYSVLKDILKAKKLS